jgi:hypothetical protein
MMSISDQLRELADRLELAGIDNLECKFELRRHRVTARIELAQWVDMMDEVCVKSHAGTFWLDGQIGDVRIAIYFKPGLIGGKAVTVYEDGNEGLAALREEFAITVEKAEAAT